MLGSSKVVSVELEGSEAAAQELVVLEGEQRSRADSGSRSRKAALSFSSSTCAWLSAATASMAPSRMIAWTSSRIFGIRSSAQLVG